MTDIAKEPNKDLVLREFYDEADQKHLISLWKISARLLPFEPKSKVTSYLWRLLELRRMAYRGGELVPISIQDIPDEGSGSLQGGGLFREWRTSEGHQHLRGLI